MSDRCYMTIECRACDVEHFEDLGFLDLGEDSGRGKGRRKKHFAIHTLEEAEGSPAIFSDLGKPDKLPTDIPYLATHAEGYEYGAWPPAWSACSRSRRCACATAWSA